MSDIKLPLMFCCANGCGVCGVTLKDFVTHATQAQDGDPWVTVASEPQIVSDCCGAEVEIWDERKQDVVAYARAAVQANVPDGWVLVPVESTDEMAAAYLKANSEYWKQTDALPTPPDRWRAGTPVDATKAGYRAMLSAIQKG